MQGETIYLAKCSQTRPNGQVETWRARFLRCADALDYVAEACRVDPSTVDGQVSSYQTDLAEVIELEASAADRTTFRQRNGAWWSAYWRQRDRRR